MPKPSLNFSAFSDPSWWHWTLTIPLLVFHLFVGQTWALPAVCLLSALAAIYFYSQLKQFRPYPVQVRIAYIIWTSIGMLPAMHWMHWIQLFGTTAMVTVGYCPLIRLLSLLPLNRIEPLTISSVGYAFFKSPCSGGLIQWASEPASQGLVCCSLPTKDLPMACTMPTSEKSKQESHYAQAH